MPKATSKLYIEKLKPKNIEAMAALLFPRFQMKPKIKGTKAPVAKKSAPIHDIVSTDSI